MKEDPHLLNLMGDCSEDDKHLSCEEILWSELEEIEKERKISSGEGEDNSFISN
jgi:hypothetical protein